MKVNSWSVLALALAITSLLIACQPIQAPMPGANGGGLPPPPPEPAAILLPDGTRCLWAGEGATLAFNDQRLNYTCGEVGEETIGLLGDLVPAETGVWSIERALIGRDSNGFVLKESESVTFLAATLDLADGAQCAFAGTGATLAFDGKRLNYTCDEEGEDSFAILGDLEAGEAGVYFAEKVLLGRNDQGFFVQTTFRVPVAQINGVTQAGDASTTGEAMAALTGVLTGTVTYLQRSALPAGSVVEVQLQDVSRADAPAQVIASQVITTAGENVPIPFALTYDPAIIDPRFNYALLVRITVEGQLRWINTKQYAVLTRDSPTTDVEVVVQPAQ